MHRHPSHEETRARDPCKGVSGRGWASGWHSGTSSPGNKPLRSMPAYVSIVYPSSIKLSNVIYSHLSSIYQSFHLFHQINTTASSNHLFLIIYLIYLSIIYLLSIYLIYLTIHPSSIHPSVHPSIHVSTIYLSNNLSVIGKRLGDPPIALCPVGHLQLYVTAPPAPTRHCFPSNSPAHSTTFFPDFHMAPRHHPRSPTDLPAHPS